MELTKIFSDLLLVAAVTCYIVGVSGFTASWRSALARMLHTTEPALRPIKPFDCPACMTWWACLIYALCVGELTLYTIAFSALLSLLSYPLCEFFSFIREGLLYIISRLSTKLWN